jgi:hypothetical protein
MNRFTQLKLSTMTRKHFFVGIFALSPFAHKKHKTESCISVVSSRRARSSFGLLKAVSEHAHARLLPRLS